VKIFLIVVFFAAAAPGWFFMGKDILKKCKNIFEIGEDYEHDKDEYF
jgi:hypothetical protein